MTLEEILEEVDLRIPNSIPEEMKIRWINAVIKQHYKDFPLPIKEYRVSAVPGESLYDLPVDCPEDRIEKVYVDEFEYTYDPYNVEAVYNKWKFEDKKVRISPTPSNTDEIVLLYKPRPAELTIADMQNSPALSEDYHELLVVGCAVRVAKTSNQYDLAQLLQAEFNTLLYGAVLSGPKRKSVVVKRAWI